MHPLPPWWGRDGCNCRLDPIFKSEGASARIRSSAGTKEEDAMGLVGRIARPLALLSVICFALWGSGCTEQKTIKTGTGSKAPAKKPNDDDAGSTTGSGGGIETK